MRNIDIMMSKPGIYAIVTAFSFGLFEVDNDGRCYQLTLDDYRRDGELRPGRWNVDAILGIYGPFARVPSEMYLRYTPTVGDYYVVYADGYKSFSPAKAFEDGYTRL